MDNPCPRTAAHEPHPWLTPGGMIGWCPGATSDVVVRCEQMIDAGLPLEVSVQTAIVQIAITAERANVTELDWKTVTVSRRTTEFTLTRPEGTRPIEALVFEVKGVRA